MRPWDSGRNYFSQHCVGRPLEFQFWYIIHLISVLAVFIELFSSFLRSTANFSLIEQMVKY